MSIVNLKIKIEEHNGLYPYIECDICRKNIIQTDENGMIFRNDKDGMVAHKKCMEKLLNNKELYPYSEELEPFFYDLLFNSKITPKEDSIRL